jgi:hypothetical protein
MAVASDGHICLQNDFPSHGTDKLNCSKISNVVWLHDNDDDHKSLTRELERLDVPLERFVDGIACQNFLNSQEENGKGSILIVLNRLGHQYVPEFQSYNTLTSIYVFCTNTNEKTKWTLKYPKVKAISYKWRIKSINMRVA